MNHYYTRHQRRNQSQSDEVHCAPAIIMQRWQSHLWLTLIAFILALLILAQQHYMQAEIIRLTPLLPDQIHYIRLDRLDQPALTLNLTANGWQITTPWQEPANTVLVEQLLPLVQARIYAHHDSTESNRQLTGTSEPWLRLQFNDLILSFGITEPINGYRYVELNGQIVLIADYFLPWLLSKNQQFRVTEAHL
jgi:hypothetical protein